MEIGRPPARPSYFSSCMASPSWFPAHRDPSRFHLLRRDGLERSRSWRNVLKRLLKESKSVYSSSKPTTTTTFGYDAVSYSKNFDDGCLSEEGGAGGRQLESAAAAGLWRTSVRQSF